MVTPVYIAVRRFVLMLRTCLSGTLIPLMHLCLEKMGESREEGERESNYKSYCLFTFAKFAVFSLDAVGNSGGCCNIYLC